MAARLFGTNGIRGVFGGDLTLEKVHDVALSMAAYFGRGPVLVCRDGRASGVPVSRVVCAALNFAGLDCKDAGLVPTPCLQYAVKSLGYSGGMMVTASHNPPEYNGIKPAAPDGVEISREDELRVEAIYYDRAWPACAGKWGSTDTEHRAIPAYIHGIRSRVDYNTIQKKKPVIVIDAGNGAQAAAAPLLCRELGCDHTMINGIIDARFSGRGPEPTPANLGELSRVVRERGADLGVAFDGDGDRSLFCDEKGDILTGDRSALLLARFILGRNPGSTVVTCINSGSSIESLAAESDSQVIRTRVGSVEVSRRMVSAGALVGFEENGGFMYGRHNQVRDGAMTMALMLELLASSDMGLSGMVRELPPSFTTKDKIPCPPGVAQEIVEALARENPGADATDGIRITLGEKDWVMVRPSGTEPIIRIYAEAGSAGGLEAIMSEYVGKMRGMIPDGA